MDFDQIDILRPLRDPLGEDGLAFENHLPHEVVGDLIARDLRTGGDLISQKPGGRRGRPRFAVARRIVIPATAALLPLASGTHQNVPQRFRHRPPRRTHAFAL